MAQESITAQISERPDHEIVALFIGNPDTFGSMLPFIERRTNAGTRVRRTQAALFVTWFEWVAAVGVPLYRWAREQVA
jgi:hypothetical protein